MLRSTLDARLAWVVLCSGDLDGTHNNLTDCTCQPGLMQPLPVYSSVVCPTRLASCFLAVRLQAAVAVVQTAAQDSGHCLGVVVEAAVGLTFHVVSLHRLKAAAWEVEE